MVEDWELDVLAARSRSPYRGTAGRKPSKLLHNIVLSMPAGTSPEKLLAASRNFAREEFALKHRYLMVCTPTKSTRTCTWSSRPSARTADA